MAVIAVCSVVESTYTIEDDPPPPPPPPPPTVPEVVGRGTVRIEMLSRKS